MVKSSLWLVSYSKILEVGPLGQTHNTALGTAVAQWLKCCATNRKVAGSIPSGVIGIFL